MNQENKLKYITNEIMILLNKLESTFWATYIEPEELGYHLDEESRFSDEYLDRKKWIYYGTKSLYYKIFVFLEQQNVPSYLNIFVEKFSKTINNEEETLKKRSPLYSEDECTMLILDDFREFLSPFSEFNDKALENNKTHKLKLILKNTSNILHKTNTKITNEASIYNSVKWFIEIVYPSARNTNAAGFVHKFKTYRPDILIPEINTAIEYKYIKKGCNVGIFIDELKTDADSYIGDFNYKYFFAVVVFEDKYDLNEEAFKLGIREKKFPNEWYIIPITK